MTGETFRWADTPMRASRQMKLIFWMRKGALKPQGSPCLKSSISGLPSGETFQTTHPVMDPDNKSKKDSLNFTFTNLFPGAIVLCKFLFTYYV